MTMTNGTRSSWDLESGLKASFDMTISQASYEHDSGYNDGKTLLLVLKGIDTDGEEQKIMYAVSPGWSPGQGGQIAVRDDGVQGRSFNKNSQIGQLITAARTCMEAAGADLTSRGSGQAWDAALWPGLTFHFERVVLNADSEQYKTERLLPTKFLGEGNATPVAGAQAAPAQGAPVASPAAPANGVGPLTMMKLKANAKKATTWDEWMEISLDLATAEPAVEAILSDPAQFEALRVS